MTFPNAYKGVKKILTAEILALIAAIALVAAGVYLYLQGGENLENIPENVLGVVAVIGLVAGVLALIALIIKLVGLAQANKDENSFTFALILTILSIIVTAADSFYLSENMKAVSQFVPIATTVLQLLSMVCIIKGIMDLAEKLDRPDMVKKGKSAIAVIVVIAIVNILCNVAGVCFQLTETMENIISLVQLVASVVTVIYLIIYIAYLAKGKKMLEA